MKKILLIISISLLTLTACNTGFETTNPKGKTTVELLDLIQDSTTYYVIIKHDELYLIDTKDNLVKYNKTDSSGFIIFMGILLMLVIIVLFLTTKD